MRFVTLLRLKWRLAGGRKARRLRSWKEGELDAYLHHSHFTAVRPARSRIAPCFAKRTSVPNPAIIGGNSLSKRVKRVAWHALKNAETPAIIGLARLARFQTHFGRVAGGDNDTEMARHADASLPSPVSCRHHLFQNFGLWTSGSLIRNFPPRSEPFRTLNVF